MWTRTSLILRDLRRERVMKLLREQLAKTDALKAEQGVSDDKVVSNNDRKSTQTDET